MRHSIVLGLAASLSTLAAANAAAQTIGGQVVDLKSHKAVSGASVALVDDSARVVANVAADSASGTFYIDAPRAGNYRVLIVTAGGSFLSPSIELAAGATVEHEFSVPDLPNRFGSALFINSVSVPAAAFPTNHAPAWPAEALKHEIRGLVSTVFVVSQEGKPDLSSFQVLGASDSMFVTPVREALEQWRFVPAQKGDSSVAQVVQMTFDYGFPGDPTRGEYTIRASQADFDALNAPVVQSGNLYVITADEFQRKDLQSLTAAQAIQRLRPLFMRTGAWVKIDGVDDPDGSVLSTLRLDQIREVRLWRKEEAQVQFGTQYMNGVLFIKTKR